MNIVSYKEFTKASKAFNTLRKHDSDFKIGIKTYNSWAHTGNQFYPIVSSCTNAEQLNRLFEGFFNLSNDSFLPRSSYIEQLFKDPSAASLSKRHTHQLDNPIQYFPHSELPWGSGETQLTLLYVFKAPHEQQVGDHTYRTVSTSQEIIMCVNEQSPVYNYLDKGHIIALIPDGKYARHVFITNQLNLDTVCLLTAFSVYPKCLAGVAQNEIFINSAVSRLALLKAEKAIPEKFRVAYKAYKDRILLDFEDHAQQIMVTKLQNNQCKQIVLNEVNISQTGAKFEHISIEAPDFRDVVFKSVNPNAEFDIFSLINIYVDNVEEQVAKQARNTTGNGFLNPLTIKLKINEIPIEVSLKTSNTRRYINGYAVTKSEVSRILRRASCHHSTAEFNTFVSSVARMSLAIHDVLSQGLPVKTYLFSTDSRNTPATFKHPKLRFKKEGAKWKLLLTDGVELPVQKIGEFVKKCQAVSRKATIAYDRTHENDYVETAVNTCERALLGIIPLYVRSATTEQVKGFLFDIKKERREAEAKSEKLLDEVVKMIGAVSETRVLAGKTAEGFTVKGNIKTYFIEKESLRVHDAVTNRYICIVNGNGDPGVGHDALIGRLMALKNDSRVAHKITTLH